LDCIIKIKNNYMKRLIIVALALFAMCGVYSRAQESKAGADGEVIFAVNTAWKVGYFTDANGRFLFKKQFQDVEAFSDGLARVKIGDRYGFLNTKGELAIPCVYDSATSFEDGLAEVATGTKYGCIDTDGQIVIPLQ
jgi:serine/threonine-protein kinase